MIPIIIDVSGKQILNLNVSHRANGQALDSVLNFMEIFAPWQDAKGIIRLGPVVRNVNSNLMLAIKGYLGSPSFRQYDQMGELAKFLLDAVAQLAIVLKAPVNFRAKKAIEVMAQQEQLLKKHGSDALLLDFDEATIAHILTELGVDSSRVTAMRTREAGSRPIGASISKDDSVATPCTTAR